MNNDDTLEILGHTVMTADFISQPDGHHVFTTADVDYEAIVDSSGKVLQLAPLQGQPPSPITKKRPAITDAAVGAAVSKAFAACTVPQPALVCPETTQGRGDCCPSAVEAE